MNKQFECKHLSSKYEVRGPHVGEYCADCGMYIRWVPKEEISTILEYCEIVGLPEYDYRRDVIEET